MRNFLIVALLLSFSTAKSQAFIPGSFIDNNYRGSLLNNIHIHDFTLNKKWFVTSYTALSTSFIFSKAGSATIFSAPIGLQLNRRLNNNLFAFAGVSAAPSYINFNQRFIASDGNKMNPMNGFKQSSLGIYSRAELGLQYINDDRTFSISGSIGIERNNYPMPIYNQMNNQSARPINPNNR